MKEEIAKLQLHILDGEWVVHYYGEIPESCGADGFRFRVDRSTTPTPGWRLSHGTPKETAEHLTEWLDTNGWSGIVFRSYTGGVSSVTVTARKPDAYIDDLLITVSPGKDFDGIILRVTGACQPGNKSNLRHFMFPDGLSGYSAPQVEHPTAKPFFGSSPLSPTPSPRPEPFNPLAVDPPTPTPTP